MMRIQKVFDTQNYDPTWDRFYQETVRAIILREGKIAPIRDNTKQHGSSPCCFVFGK